MTAMRLNVGYNNFPVVPLCSIKSDVKCRQLVVAVVYLPGCTSVLTLPAWSQITLFGEEEFDWRSSSHSLSGASGV